MFSCKNPRDTVGVEARMARQAVTFGKTWQLNKMGKFNILLTLTLPQFHGFLSRVSVSFPLEIWIFDEKY